MVGELRRGLRLALAAWLLVGLSACEKENPRAKDKAPETPAAKGDTQGSAHGSGSGGQAGSPSGPGSTATLKLGQSYVEPIAGTPLEIAITGGSGAYGQPAVEPEGALTAEVKAGKLVLKVQKAGAAKVTLTDTKTGKTAALQARAFMLPFEWVDIPAGTFQMGSPETDTQAYDDEKPQHEVRLTGFRLATTEVTFVQYDAFCEATNREKPEDEGWGRGDRPVMNVSWDDAQAFCAWAGVQLPTEAQWEYAARGGNSGKYCFGDDAGQLGDYAWYDGNAGGQTHPVKGKRANGFGLYDMHGSVYEWCADQCSEETYKTYYQSCKAEGTVTDPVGPGAGALRVNRGGSWYDDTRLCRSAIRGGLEPSNRGNLLGFRVAAPPAPES